MSPPFQFKSLKAECSYRLYIQPEHQLIIYLWSFGICCTEVWNFILVIRRMIFRIFVS